MFRAKHRHFVIAVKEINVHNGHGAKNFNEKTAEELVHVARMIEEIEHPNITYLSLFFSSILSHRPRNAIFNFAHI